MGALGIHGKEIIFHFKKEDGKCVDGDKVANDRVQDWIYE
jgi:hypothetical protein